MKATETIGKVSLMVLAMFSLGLTSNAQSRKAQSPKESASLSEKAKEGKLIFNDYCYRCHEVDSERAKPLGPMGPVLNGLFKKDKLMVGKPVTEANVKEVIKMGPTPGMPGFRYTLTGHEIDDLVEYLKVE